MPDAKHFFSEPIHYIVALVGEPGSGKTRAALSFPSCYVICCDPAGIEILKEPSNASLKDNLVWYEYFASESKKEVADLFKVTDDPENRTSIYGCLAHVKQLAEKGEVKTLVLDGFSYLGDLMGIRATATSAGNVEDRFAYYRQLKNDMTWFTKAHLMTLATRYGLNIILTLHVQRQSEEAMSKQATKDIDIAPRLEGSFRTALAGLPRAMIYLDHTSKPETVNGKPKHVVRYKAYCQKVRVGNMGVIPAKNSYGLPPVVDLTGQSLFEVMERATKPQQELPLEVKA
jgi:hypothetical protein